MGAFCFKKFKVDDGDCAMKVGTDAVLLGAWTRVDAAREIIDIGAGSGVLSLMVAQRSAQAHVTAVEIDALAAQCAAANFAASPWSDRLTVVCSDAMAYNPVNKADLIISNPPFFANGILSPHQQRAMARHATAAMGPAQVLAIAARLLADDGSVAMITPAEYANDLLFESERLRLNLWRRCSVTTVAGKAPRRLLWQWSRKAHRVEETSLAIRDVGEFTPQYVNLTKDFYLNF